MKALALGLALLLAACGAPRSGRLPLGPDQLEYEWAGQGEPLVLIGGGGLDRRQWEAVAAELARDHRVLTYDLRGWGASAPASAEHAHHEDLLALLEHLEWKRVDVLGLSFGGLVAVDLALAAPERVRSLVLVGPALSGYPFSASFYERHGAAHAVRLAQGLPAMVEHMLADGHFLPGAAADPALAERYRALALANAQVHAIDPSLVRFLDPPAYGRLGELRAPVRVLVPELDEPELFELAQSLVEAAPDARAERLPGVGHMAHLEDPQALAERVRALLLEAGR